MAGESIRMTGINLNNKISSLLLWIALAGTLLPYRFNKSSVPFSAYTYPVAVLLVVAAGFYFLLKPYIRHLTATVAKQSPHFFIYFTIVFISQFVATMLDTRLKIVDFIWMTGYIVIGLLSYFIFAIAIGNRLFKQWIYFLLVAGGVSSAIGIYAALTGKQQVLNLHIRQLQPYTPLGISTTSSIFYETNRFAIVAFFGLLAALYLLMKRKNVAIALIVLFLCFGGVIVSWARAVYLALIITFLVWSILKVRRSRRFMLAVALVFIAFIGLTIVLSIENLYLSFFAHGWSGRDEIWPVAISMILNRPLWGYGFGRWEVTRDTIYAYTGFEYEAHSTPLCIALNAGIPAMILYFVIFAVSLRRLQRSSLTRLEKATIAGGVVGMLISGLFLDYNLGGASYGSFVQMIFLGLANAAPWLRQGHRMISRGDKS